MPVGRQRRQSLRVVPEAAGCLAQEAAAGGAVQESGKSGKGLLSEGC